MGTQEQDIRQRKKKKPEVTDVEEMFGILIADYTTTKQPVILQMRQERISQDAFMRDVREHILQYYDTSREVRCGALTQFEQYIFGYSRLTNLINSPEVSDIRCVRHDSIRIKRKGRRMAADVKFGSAQEYRSFIDMLATRNHVNISNLNAIQRFTDVGSSEDFILRFTVVMPLLTTYEQPYLCIRKVPKNFPEMPALVKAGMMSGEVAEMLVERFREGSTLICGGNSSGKTTILNALKETIPEDRSVLITQQADELTTKGHPDMMFLHSLPGMAESQVSYDLKDISIAGLTMDVDYFIVGEVKGEEAMYLLNAAYTGQICAATIHAPSADKALEKVADYSMYGSQYSRDELMKMLSCFHTVVFMRGYKVCQVYDVIGWSQKVKNILYRKLYVDAELARREKEANEIPYVREDIVGIPVI